MDGDKEYSFDPNQEIERMAETNYTGSMDSEQEGDIVLDPKTRLGSVGTLDSTKVEVTEGADIVSAVVSEDKLKVTVTTNGTPGNAVVVVTADKNLDPSAEDNEVGIFNITVTPAGTQAVPMTFANVRDRA